MKLRRQSVEDDVEFQPEAPPQSGLCDGFVSSDSLRAACGAETTSSAAKGVPTTVKIVSSADELRMVYAVRAAVFLGAPGWTYETTFDGNDFAATHILALKGREPIGTTRLRWFAEFARIERIAVRPEYRSLSVLNGIARAALRLCRKKGYDKVAGLSSPKLVRFWARHGAHPCGEALDSAFGPAVPIIGTPRTWSDIRPVSVTNAGDPAFEWKVYSWEGDDI